jgi:hypothetical protein
VAHSSALQCGMMQLQHIGFGDLFACFRYAVRVLRDPRLGLDRQASLEALEAHVSMLAAAAEPEEAAALFWGIAALCAALSPPASCSTRMLHALLQAGERAGGFGRVDALVSDELSFMEESWRHNCVQALINKLISEERLLTASPAPHGSRGEDATSNSRPCIPDVQAPAEAARCPSRRALILALQAMLGNIGASLVGVQEDQEPYFEGIVKRALLHLGSDISLLDTARLLLAASAASLRSGSVQCMQTSVLLTRTHLVGLSSRVQQQRPTPCEELALWQLVGLLDWATFICIEILKETILPSGCREPISDLQAATSGLTQALCLPSAGEPGGGPPSWVVYLADGGLQGLRQRLGLPGGLATTRAVEAAPAAVALGSSPACTSAPVL